MTLGDRTPKSLSQSHSESHALSARRIFLPIHFLPYQHVGRLLPQIHKGPQILDMTINSNLLASLNLLEDIMNEDGPMYREFNGPVSPIFQCKSGVSFYKMDRYHV